MSREKARMSAELCLGSSLLLGDWLFEPDMYKMSSVVFLGSSPCLQIATRCTPGVLGTADCHLSSARMAACRGMLDGGRLWICRNMSYWTQIKPKCEFWSRKALKHQKAEHRRFH